MQIDLQNACRMHAECNCRQAHHALLMATPFAQGMDVVAALAALPRVKDNTNSPFFQAGKLSGEELLSYDAYL